MPNEDTYGFSKPDAEQIVQSLDSGDRIIPGSASPAVVFFGSRMGKTDGSGMTAASGDTMGSGTVALQYLSGSTLTAGGGNVTAYNWSDEAVGANTKVRVAQDMYGVWWLAGVNC